MVDGNHHIDKFFRDALEGFRPSPPPGVLEYVQERTGRKKVLAPYWRWAAAAAASLLIIVAGILSVDRGRDAGILAVDETAGPAETLTVPVQPGSTAIVEELTARPGREEVAVPADSQAEVQKAATPAQTAMAPAETFQPLLPVATTTAPVRPAAGKPAPVNLKLALIGGETTASLHTPAMTETPAIEWEAPPQNLRWGISGQFSPLYSYRFLTSTDNQTALKNYYNNIESGMMSFSGGFSINLQPSDRLVFSTGVFYSVLGQNIQGVSELTISSLGWQSSPILALIEEKYFLIENSTGTIESGSKYVNIIHGHDQLSSLTGSRPNQISWSDLENIDAQILQRYQFVELPLVLKYKFIDKKMNMNLVTGLSTNFLVGNQATLLIRNEEYASAQTDHINAVNYSSILGVGVDYEIIPGILLSLEPTFKYYLNSFSNKDLIVSHPYTLALFSGIRFIF